MPTLSTEVTCKRCGTTWSANYAERHDGFYITYRPQGKPGMELDRCPCCPPRQHKPLPGYVHGVFDRA
jgi:hypothetical protein